MDRCECWTIKKALINWCFWAMVLDKTFESPLDCRRSNQSILKKTNPEYPLEGLMLKLKLQYFGYLLQRVDSLEKTMMLGKIEGRRRGWQRCSGCLCPVRGQRAWPPVPAQLSRAGLHSQGTWCSWLLQSMGSQRVGLDWVTELIWFIFQKYRIWSIILFFMKHFILSPMIQRSTYFSSSLLSHTFLTFFS